VDDSIQFSHKIVQILQVEVRLDTQSKIRGFYTSDISKGGVFLHSKEPMEVGTRVELIIHPPERYQPFMLQGSVIRKVTPEQARLRQISPGMGIRFGSVKVDSRLVIIMPHTGFEVAGAGNGVY